MKNPIPRSALEHHIAFVGKTGSGKTGSAKSGIIEPALAAGERVCVIDPTGAWWGLRLAADGKSKGLPIYVFGGDHGDFPLLASQGEMVAVAIGETSTPAILDTTLLRTGERMRFFTDFADTILRVNKGPLRLVIDEAHLFAPQAGTRGAGAMPDMLHAANNLISLGRSRGLRIVLISQRPAKVHKDSLTQVESLVAMRLIAPQDRKAVEEWIADQADKDTGKEIIASLPSLKTGEAWVWSPEAHFLKRVTFPMPATYDSSKVQGTGRATKRLSPIDVEKLQEKFAKVKTEAAARDPAALQKRVRELELQLARTPTAKPGAPAAAAAPKKEQLDKIKAQAIEQAKKAYAPLRSALEAAMKFIVEINARDFFKEGGEAVDKKAVEKVITDATAHATRLIEGHLTARERQLTAVKADAQKLLTRLKALIDKADEDVKVSVNVTHNKPFTISAPARSAPPPRAPRSAGANNGAGGDANLTPAKQKILDAIAWAAMLGKPTVPKDMVAFLAGASPTSSGFQNNLGALRSAGLIEYPAGGEVALTTEGAAIAVPPEHAPTHDAIMQAIAARLAPAQMRILQAASAAYPEDLGKDELAGQVEASPTSSGYQNNLGRLRTLGFITYPTTGRVRAGESLFP